jgi:hypothetical protein
VNIPQPPGPRWYMTRPFKNRGQGLAVNPHYNPCDYYISDSDAESIRRWIPDFDPQRVFLPTIEALLLTQFNITPDACQQLTWTNIVAILNSQYTTPPAQAPMVDTPPAPPRDWLRHALAFVVIREADKNICGDLEAKEQSKIMERIRLKAGPLLICQKVGRQYQYDRASLGAVANLIRKSGGIDRYDPSPAQIAVSKKRIKAEKTRR